MVGGLGVAETRHKGRTTSPKTTFGGSTRTFREPVHDDGYFDEMWRGTANTDDAGAVAGASVGAGVGASTGTKAPQLSSTSETSQPRRQTSLGAWFLSRVAGSTRGNMIDHLKGDDMNEAPNDAQETTPSLEHSNAAYGAASDPEEAEVIAGTAARAKTSQPIDRNVLIEATIEHHTPGDDDYTPEIQSCDRREQTHLNGEAREEGPRGPKLNVKSRLSSSSWTGIIDDKESPFRELNVYDENFAGDEPDDTGELEIEAASKAKGHVNFLSATMGLTVDVSGVLQPPEGDRDHDDWPASPCIGVIRETSPRYCALQAFRKQICYRGIDAQMIPAGWMAKFLPARNIRLFMTDTRQSSVLYWRYRRKSQQRRGAAGRSEELGAEDPRTIPLRSLANIGWAEPTMRTTRHHGNSLWSMWTAAGRRGSKEQSVPANKASDGVERKEGAIAGLDRVVPVVAISYWEEGEPRWVGDEPNRLILKLESLDGFKRLSDGLRLCCLHFHNYACPQDLEDTQ